MSAFRLITEYKFILTLLSWFAFNVAANDFPVLSCFSGYQHKAGQDIAAYCRLSPLSLIYGQQYEQQEDAPVMEGANTPGDINTRNPVNSINDDNCRFLLVQEKQFVFTENLLLDKNNRLTPVQCPSVMAGQFNVVAVDLSKAGHCHIQVDMKVKSDNDFQGLSVNTAIVQCPLFGRNSKDKNTGEEGQGESDTEASQAPGEGGGHYESNGRSGASAGAGGGGGGDKGGPNKKPAADDGYKTIDELFIAFLNYLLRSTNELEREEGEKLLERFRYAFSSKARSPMLRWSLDSIEKLELSAESISLLQTEFSTLPNKTKKELFRRAAMAERHIKSIAHTSRARWRKIYSETNDKGKNVGVSDFVNEILKVPGERDPDSRSYFYDDLPGVTYCK